MPHGGYHGTVMMGGNVIQQGGTGKDAGKLAPKDDKGQFIPFKTPLVNMPSVPTGQSTGPAGQTTPSDILQNIVDQKDILKFQPSPDRPGMNAYQDAIQNFRTASPANMAAYGQRFPLTQFAMTGLPSIMTSMIPGGNVFFFFFNAYQSGKGRVQGGLSAVADEFSGTLSGLKSLLPTSLGGANIPGEPSEFVAKKFVNESKPDIFELNTSTDTPDSQLLFKIPGTPGYMIQKDPKADINKFVDLAKYPGTFVTFNEGGLASLNNQEYGMLMNASDFSL